MSRRIFPIHNDTHGKSKKHPLTLVLLGCSYLDGSGLQDSETLPVQLHKLLKKEKRNYDVQVLSIPGSSFLDFQDLIRANHPIWSEFKVPGKIAFIYIMPDFHIERVGVTYENFWSRTGNVSRYKVEKRHLTFVGSYNDFFPGKLKLIQFISNFVHPKLLRRILRCCFVEPYSNEDYFRMLDAFMANFAEMYPHSMRYVYIHPESSRIKLKDGSNFKAWNTTQVDDENLKIPFDGHPNGRMNKYVSANLLDFIKTIPVEP